MESYFEVLQVGGYSVCTYFVIFELVITVLRMPTH